MGNITTQHPPRVGIIPCFATSLPCLISPEFILLIGKFTKWVGISKTTKELILYFQNKEEEVDY
jgi:hypothetical protein